MTSLDFKSTAGFRGYSYFFTRESVAHPAKANLNLLKFLISKYTKPGQTVLDPMCGTGTVGVVASSLGRNAVLVELESEYVKFARENVEKSLRQDCFDDDWNLVKRGFVKVVEGDARQLSALLESVDAVVTSPPYEGTLSDRRDPADKVARMKALSGSFAKTHNKQAMSDSFLGAKYSDNPENLGNLKSGSYLSAMQTVYSECFKVLRDNGVMVLITKNFIRDRKVVRLDLDTVKVCESVGFRLLERHQFKLPQESFWRIQYRLKNPTAPTINHEDVLVFKKVTESEEKADLLEF